MSSRMLLSVRFFVLFFLSVGLAHGQSILPPEIEWKGASESLIAKPDNQWITPTEKSNFASTPTYAETLQWFKKLTDASPLLTLVSIGQSAEGRDIFMIIASTEKTTTAEALKKSGKPLVLAQAGIHAGEIDGKDAGMMLLRDIAFGGKKYLLDEVNFLFIPILNVDGHERISAYNRPNQRGPENMGWRTNAKNLNLNRDYAKLDTKEIRAVVSVMNAYDPLLYMDLHVTDGADYQYDITFGGYGQQGYSPAINAWMERTYLPAAYKDLTAQGHIPGQLLFAKNDRDFSEGNLLSQGGPRFSDAYGDARHMPSLLVENHSLKPFKQRVLGTYVLLESTLKILVIHGQALREGVEADRMKRAEQVPLAWNVPQMQDGSAKEIPTDTLMFLGIASQMVRSSITNAEYVEWLGKPERMRVANYKATQPTSFVTRPKGYWIPAVNEDVIERLKWHGIKMEILTQPRTVAVEMYRIREAAFVNGSGAPKLFEGRLQVSGSHQAEKRTQVFATGSAFVSTDQPLGDLAMLLLEPNSEDSFLQWGFFNEIFQRTEYAEAYVMEPLMKKMLEESAELRAEFEQRKASDAAFANNPRAITAWFYSKSPYYDARYLLYPVGKEL